MQLRHFFLETKERNMEKPSAPREHWLLAPSNRSATPSGARKSQDGNLLPPSTPQLVLSCGLQPAVINLDVRKLSTFEL